MDTTKSTVFVVFILLASSTTSATSTNKGRCMYSRNYVHTTLCMPISNYHYILYTRTLFHIICIHQVYEIISFSCIQAKKLMKKCKF